MHYSFSDDRSGPGTLNKGFGGKFHEVPQYNWMVIGWEEIFYNIFFYHIQLISCTGIWKVHIVREGGQPKVHVRSTRGVKKVQKTVHMV